MAFAHPLVFDASGVGSEAVRRAIERTLLGLSLRQADGLWQAMEGPRASFPSDPALVIRDLHEATTSSAWEHFVGGPSWVVLVALVRTLIDKQRLALAETALQVKDERVFLLDMGASDRVAGRAGLIQEYFRGLVERLEPDRVLAARFSVLDGILWTRFGDGLVRALDWRTLPFAGKLTVSPVAASVGEFGQSVVLRDKRGKQVDISASSLRAAVDAGFKAQVEVEDAEERGILGRRIRALRERLALSQEEVTRRSGIPQESLSRLETGRRDPRIDTLRKLARGFEMTLPELLGALGSEEQAA